MSNYFNPKIQSLALLAQANKIPILCLASLASFVYLTRRFYFVGGRCTSKKRLDGKTVVITGANTGIGKETALEMARRGARVILACRDTAKAKSAAKQIRNLSGNGNVAVEELDLASLDSVEQFSKKIIAQEERIDILINNAGIMMCPKWKTKDGFEMQFGTNHLGHFLLTNLLLDKIKSSAPSRIVNVSSLAHERGKMNWDDLMCEKSYDPQDAYRQSKLANVLFTRELASRLKGTGVSTFSLHPGVVRTELGRYFADVFGWKFHLIKFFLIPISYWFFKNSRQGAQTSIHCALDDNITGLSGEYFSDCKPKKMLPHALNEDDAKHLWKISEKLTKLK
ncbi:retinol dehydrogenase 13-like [Brachionus plicatilis]|uniref:Retinol dehydrogenase 13-like n=1 Tax=Brachionus plicatilis TaxID=10195 RepID=A0A3M7R6H5_BRAPC|nr:retinol dehydrogenase 13-like [Brachionus plicatilis]